MVLGEVVKASFETSFALYDDLAESLDEGTLADELPGLPSNSVGAQLWCVVGARESYSRAIKAGSWTGFSCSLTGDQTNNKKAVQRALKASAQDVREALFDLDSQEVESARFVLDLLGHESAHQGQLIRYLYGLKLTIPESWKSRYTLD